MLLRLTPAYGGDGTTHGIITMNDTGSNMLTLFAADLQQLGNIQGYMGWLGLTNVRDASGTITVCPRILVQVQLVRDDNTPWGGWIDELAIVKQPVLNVPRLSEVRMRRGLYIGTAPGNHLLAISATKGGLTS
jgi:hypothetical protein